MSGLPIESNYSHEPTRPVSDDERAELTRRVNEAYEKGELPLETYQEVMDGIYSAKTVGELVPLVSSLPARYHATDPQGSQSQVELAPGEVNNPVTRPDTSSKLVRTVLFSTAGIIVLAVVLVIVLVIF